MYFVSLSSGPRSSIINNIQIVIYIGLIIIIIIYFFKIQMHELLNSHQIQQLKFPVSYLDVVSLFDATCSIS
jgi:hypothetical protein